MASAVFFIRQNQNRARQIAASNVPLPNLFVQSDLDEAMTEERQKSRDAVGIIKEKTKEDMGQYIKEKEKVCDASCEGG